VHSKRSIAVQFEHGCARRRTRIAPVGSVVAYIRVSTDEQASNGAGLDAQRAAIAAEVERRGWHVVAWLADEGISGGTGVTQPSNAGRPVMARPMINAWISSVPS
jgi:resolvase-like protein